MTPETIIKKQIKDYLKIKHWMVFHILQGIGSYHGICDLIAIKNGLVYFIEVKTENGRQSEAQKQFGTSIVLSGGNYIIVKSLDDIIKIA